MNFPLAATAPIELLGHWASLLPLAACALLWLRDRRPSREALYLALAFFVSYPADVVGDYLQGQHANNWWLTYVTAPIQFGLMAYVLVTARAFRLAVMIGCVLLTVLSVLRGTLAAPETVVQCVIGALVGLAAWQHAELRKYRPAILLYCWAAIPFLVGMAAVDPRRDGPWLWIWAAYQAVRVSALAWMVRALIFQPRLRLEVVGGRGTNQGAARRGTPDIHSSRDPVQAVAREAVV